MPISATDTVGRLAVQVPSASRVFEKLGIDYCCAGHHSLEDACRSAGIAVEDVIRSLEKDESTEASEQFKDWESEPLSRLTSYIVDKHHAFTREELDRLGGLLSKVCTVHGEGHPELLRISGVFKELAQDLIPHMFKEEQVLFPYIIQMEEAVNSRRQIPAPFFGTVRNPIRMMMLEHETAGELLKAIREFSSDFTVPAEACSSYQTLYQALRSFETDLHQHIHLENNILFPRAAEMESSV